jgi:predicted kinase
MVTPPILVIAVGLPASGKSTYFANIGAQAISTDNIRLQLADDATDQTIHGAVFATVRFLIRQRVAIQRPITYIDATSLTRKDRKFFLKIAKQHGCLAEAIFFDTPLDVCLERNRNRQRVVPEDVIRTMATKLAPPTEAEGFSRVTIVTP